MILRLLGIIPFFLLGGYTFTFSQTPKKFIDSLQHELKHTDDQKQRLRILAILTEVVAYRDIKKAEAYANETYNIVSQPQYKSQAVIAYHSLGFIAYRKSNYPAALQWLQKAENAFNQATDSLDISHTYKKTGMVYTRLGKHEQALRYHQKSLAIAKARKDQKGISATYHAIANVYYFKGDYDQSIRYFKQSLKINRVLGKTQNRQDAIGSLLNNIGGLYGEKGNYFTALEYFHQSLKIRLESKNKPGTASCYYNIGEIYRLLTEHDKAIEFYYKALPIRKSIGEKTGVIECYNSLGTTYNKLGKPTKALEYFLQSNQLAKSIQNKGELGRSLLGLAQTWLALGKLIKAQAAFEKSLKLSQQIGQKSLIAQSQVGLANLFRQTQKWTMAIGYGQKGYRLAREIGQKYTVKQATEILANAYAKTQQYQKAFDFLTIFKNTSDSLINAENIKKITILESQQQYEIEKQKQALELAQKEMLMKAELRQQKRLRRSTVFGLSMSFLLVLVILLFFYYRYRVQQRQKWSQELKRQEQLKRNAVIAAQEAQQKKIAQELHDGVGQLLVALKLNLEAIAKNIGHHSPSSWENALQLLDKVTNDVRAVSHLAMPNLIKSDGLVMALEHLMEKTFGYDTIAYTFEHYNLQEKYPETLEINVYRVIQELISNVIKHANATQVNLQIYQVEQTLYVRFEDDGRGFDTQKMTSAGVGLLSIGSRVDFLSGNIHFEKEENGGMVVKVSLPLQQLEHLNLQRKKLVA